MAPVHRMAEGSRESKGLPTVRRGALVGNSRTVDNAKQPTCCSSALDSVRHRQHKRLPPHKIPTTNICNASKQRRFRRVMFSPSMPGQNCAKRSTLSLPTTFCQQDKGLSRVSLRRIRALFPLRQLSPVQGAARFPTLMSSI